MPYSVNTLLTDIAGAFHGTTANKIPNIYGIVSRAARDVLLDVDPKETQAIGIISGVTAEVFDYPCPVDLKGDRVIDIYPQSGRTPDDLYEPTYSQDFDANKGISFDKKLYTQWRNGVKTIRIEAPTLNATTDFEIVYYSKYLFRDPVTNAFQEAVADTTDNAKIINLDTDSYNLLFNKTAYYVAQALQGADADYDATFYSGEYDAALARYRALNPSESLLKATQYYQPGSKSYRRFPYRS
jgi:hypothetical protein